MTRADSRHHTVTVRTASEYYDDEQETWHAEGALRRRRERRAPSGEKGVYES